MIGTLDIKTRPLRLAYLVDPDNAEQVREAIRLSSTLWGGVFFPIIPLYKRMPATWRDKPLKAPLAKNVILGYIEAFDPDVLVQFSKTVPDFVSKTGLEIIKPDEVWNLSDEERSFSPRFGIGIFELLSDIYDKYFKYKAKYPVKVIFPKVPRQLSLFWASWFGEILPQIMPVLEKKYFKPIEAETADFDPSKLDDYLKGNILFPRRLVQHEIEERSRATFRRSAYVFFMDATKIDDVVDFWNLRAVGRDVLPLPKQLQSSPGMNRVVISFLKAHRIPWKHDKKVCDVASVVRSRNSTIEEMQEYAKTLKIERDPGDPSDYGFFALQHWYPRIWDEWARDKDGVVPNDIYSGEENSIEVAEIKELKVRFRSLLPRFAQKYGYHGEPRCGNELSFRFYGSDEYIAEVFPKSPGKNFNRVISGLTSLRGDWRVGRNGLVKLVRDEFNETREIPLSQKVFFAWLEDIGWKAKPSASGLLAKQIYKKLEGYLGILKNEKFLGLLEHMNGGLVKQDGSPVSENKISQERELPVGEVKNRLSDNPNSNLHDYLVSKDIFKLGARIQCPYCMRNSWFPLGDVRDNFVCPKCLNTFPAIGNLDSGQWCYKTAGPFSVSNYAEGAYAVLLTLDFFNDHKMTTMRITPALSFVAESETQKDIEADFAAFWQESIFGERRDGILFAECKTYGTFKKKDFERMRYLANTFPGSVLVFSTLRKSLTKEEIKEITRITKAGRKYWKTERPINPILILTGTELLHHMGPPYCWDEAAKKRFDHIGGLMSLCNASQQIYLNLPSWQHEWHDKWEKRRLKYQAKKETT